jgi:hypothetical protein
MLAVLLHSCFVSLFGCSCCFDILEFSLLLFQLELGEFNFFVDKSFIYRFGKLLQLSGVRNIAGYRSFRDSGL